MEVFQTLQCHTGKYGVALTEISGQTLRFAGALPYFQGRIAEALSSFTGLQRCPCAGTWEMVFQTFTGLQAGARCTRLWKLTQTLRSAVAQLHQALEEMSAFKYGSAALPLPGSRCGVFSSFTGLALPLSPGTGKCGLSNYGSGVAPGIGNSGGAQNYRICSVARH
jgi:hypothetical protein